MQQPQIDRLEVFGSPIRVSHLEGLGALGAELTIALTQEAASSPGVHRSNVGGWHSPPDLTLRPGPPFEPLMRRLAAEIDATVKELAHVRGQLHRFAHGYGIHAWAMVLGKHDYITPHDHAESHLSAVYYIDAGDPPGGSPSGRLVFRTERAGMVPGLDIFPSEFSIQPETGMMVIFPGHLTHYVHPYRGERPRICVSLNARIEPRRAR